MDTEKVKHMLFMSYNLEIMDLIFLVIVLAIIATVCLAKIHGLRARMDAVEKHLNLNK